MCTHSMCADVKHARFLVSVDVEATVVSGHDACRFDGHSGDEGPIGREALDSEEDDFDAQPYSPEGRSGDVLDASDDDDALFVAFDDAIARKDKPAQGSQDKDRMEEGLEDEDLEDEDV